jgi:hypothetical protein
MTYANFSDTFLPSDDDASRRLLGKQLNYTDDRPIYELFDVETMHSFVDVWRAIASVESFAESIRRSLIQRPDFNLLQAFKSLDHDFDGSISVKDVSHFLSPLFDLTCLDPRHDG